VSGVAARLRDTREFVCDGMLLRMFLDVAGSTVPAGVVSKCYVHDIICQAKVLCNMLCNMLHK
jgi:hypothetical protein